MTHLGLVLKETLSRKCQTDKESPLKLCNETSQDADTDKFKGSSGQDRRWKETKYRFGFRFELNECTSSAEEDASN